VKFLHHWRDDREDRRLIEAENWGRAWVAWQQARTLAELGELTAQWLEGATPQRPMYIGAPDPETKPLIPHLVGYNRRGYLTDQSQPGSPLENGWAQRAWVHGFGTAELADRIEDALLDTELIVGRTPPGGDNPTRICVTIGHERAWTIGGAMRASYLAEQYREAIPAALPALLNAWQIEVIDPVWGRNDLLWDRLDRAFPAPLASLAVSP
jgi:hypothetical protein